MNRKKKKKKKNCWTTSKEKYKMCNEEEMEIKSSPIVFNLKTLQIQMCNGLKCIFPIGIFQGLMQLEELEVFNCFNMEDLFEFEFEECQEEEDGSITIRLPHLRFLSLVSLPRLSSFFCHQRRLPRVLLDFPSLKNLHIHYCLHLKRLPFGPQSTPKLTEFDIEYDDEEWFERLEWDDLSVKALLQQLLQLINGATMVLLLLSSGIDPGIVPCNPHPPEHEDKGYSSSLSSDSPGNQGVAPRLPPTKDILGLGCGKLEAGVLHL
ncbi:hypothetical protein GIB67_004127 [Kingdonia uniflora]|uniref:Disease resistance protein At4g27190-like leucine-rich repeats domain-containing protein n=1 Tax=Kingdonia uniflora TaxID=39325 RepID=A0A7J7NRB4_9MAGN|nr:hypothetical protein GIB67_004127 [Kingdonia uniflora]